MEPTGDNIELRCRRSPLKPYTIQILENS